MRYACLPLVDSSQYLMPRAAALGRCPGAFVQRDLPFGSNYEVVVCCVVCLKTEDAKHATPNAFTCKLAHLGNRLMFAPACSPVFTPALGGGYQPSPNPARQLVTGTLVVNLV